MVTVARELKADEMVLEGEKQMGLKAHPYEKNSA